MISKLVSAAFVLDLDGFRAANTQTARWSALYVKELDFGKVHLPQRARENDSMSDYCEICGEEASRATWDGKQEHPLCESCCRAINSEDETEDEANV